MLFYTCWCGHVPFNKFALAQAMHETFQMIAPQQPNNPFADPQIHNFLQRHFPPQLEGGSTSHSLSQILYAAQSTQPTSVAEFSVHVVSSVPAIHVFPVSTTVFFSVSVTPFIFQLQWLSWWTYASIYVWERSNPDASTTTILSFTATAATSSGATTTIVISSTTTKRWRWHFTLVILLVLFNWRQLNTYYVFKWFFILR